MTWEQRQQIETQIKNDFLELQRKLENLKKEVQSATDETRREEKNEHIQNLEEELAEMQRQMDVLSDLREEELLSLKTKLEDSKNAYQEYRWEVADLQNEKLPTPTTYELLKDSATVRGFEWDAKHPWLLKIIESNPKEFKNLPWDTAEKKLEYIFTKIHNSIVLFMKNKLWNSEKYNEVISSTIAPGFEWSLMELLRDQTNEVNVSMLQWVDKISFSSLGKLVRWVWNFAKTAWASYDKFNQWMNAIDYLSVHNWVLSHPEKSEVLTNPLNFKTYINNPKFKDTKFSPYTLIEWNIFGVSDEETFAFWLSLNGKQNVLESIWKIKVKNDPKTTSLIAKMLDKPEKFLQKTEWLQATANGLLDGIDSLNSVTKVFWVDILWEITKAPEKRSFLYRILDFVCKLIWITWWLEWIVKRWRMDRMNLTDEKNDDIKEIFEEYKEDTGQNTSLNITDENSCKAVLKDFDVTDLKYSSSTKWDYLRDSIAKNMDVSLISPAIVKQAIEENILSWGENKYLKKETVTVNWKQQEKTTIISEGFTSDEKKKLAQYHLSNMKSHLQEYNKNNLRDFYTSIDSTDDIALCITASLYANKDDVIEWIKAKVFLPENYGSVHSNWTVDGWNEGETANPDITLSELTPDEKTEMQNLVEQSKTPNTINYLENSTYKKYLNIIEDNLNLPKYALECVCSQESGWRLYRWNNILWSSAWAQWLFQFMPATADQYMKHSKLWEKYWKIFSFRDEFLKDPLASAWAAWIMYSVFMDKYNYNFQSSLACYNRWIGNYKNRIWESNLSSDNFSRLPQETQTYVQNITTNILSHNSSSSSDVLLADLWQYSWDKTEMQNLA